MRSGLNIVFFGTPEFAAHILDDLVDRGEKIVAVVTTPDKPQGRGRKLAPSAVRVVAEKRGIPVLTPNKHKDEAFINDLRRLSADVFLVVAYKILPREVFTVPRLGTFNIHASLLPQYRGAAPINWAIIHGESETGLTTFLLDDRVDTGMILLQDRIPIGNDETAGELHDRMMLRGADIAQRTLCLLASGEARPQKQPLVEPSHTALPLAPKIFPDDCKLDLRQSSSDLLNVIRGLSPYPGASVELSNGLRLKVIRARSSDRDDLARAAFAVTQDHRQVFLGCGDHEAIELVEVQVPGKRVMTVEELLRGSREFFSDIYAST